MFGGAKIKELENKVLELKRTIEKNVKERDELKTQLDNARKRVSELESELRDTDLDQLKKELKSSIAEYEGLKELYNRKIQEFESGREEKEQEFARTAAVERFNLDNEIHDNRKANQEYVSSTVKTFTESYQYYLNQIRLLMDALGDVATKAGEELFAGPNDDLKAKIGQRMADKLKAETDPLRNNDGDLILIGGPEEVEAAVAQAVEEAPAPVQQAVAEAAVEEAVTEAAVEEAAEEAVEEAATEAVEEAATEAAVEEAATEAAVESAAKEASREAY